MGGSGETQERLLLTPLRPPLFSVFLGGDEAQADAISATINALAAQRFRNIEVFLTAGDRRNPDPAWKAACLTLRGLSAWFDGADTARNWRGDYACILPAGTVLGPDFFVRAAAALDARAQGDCPELIRFEGEPDIVLLSRNLLSGEGGTDIFDRLTETSASVVREGPENASSLTIPAEGGAEWWGDGVATAVSVAVERRRIPRTLRRWRRSIRKRIRKLFRREKAFRDWLEHAGLFDGEWYLRVNGDVRDAQLDPLKHYLARGWKEGRSPSPLLNPVFFRELFPGMAEDDNPLMQLAETGTAKRTQMLGRLNALQLRIEALSSRREGVCISGGLYSEVGLGQAARNLSYAADAARIPLSMHVSHTPEPSSEREFLSKCGRVMDRRATIHVHGGAFLVPYVEKTGSDRRDILYPFWELARLPRKCRPLVSRFDEIWAPSSFVAEAFAEFDGLPVSILPQAVRIPQMDGAGESGPFTVLAYLDFASMATRKNPEAAVAAFRQAFPPSRTDVRLRVKVRGGGDMGRREWLARMAASDGRIEVIDRTMGREEMDRLVMSCDAFISLHRSEGFGFGPAEALAAGKPVVSTDFSGTTDFIGSETGYPVAYKLIPVEPESYLDWEGQVWAEPDIDDAARALREIADDYEAAKMKGARGRQLMIDRFSPEAVGRQMRGMLIDRGVLEELAGEGE